LSFYTPLPYLSGVIVGGFVEGEDQDGVEDDNGMKEGLGGETVELSFPWRIPNDLGIDRRCVLGSDDLNWGDVTILEGQMMVSWTCSCSYQGDKLERKFNFANKQVLENVF